MMRFEFAVAADLAANLLSVCLVVFLTLLPLAGRTGAPSTPETQDALGLVERRALDGPAMLALLRARRADPALVVLDLYANRVERRVGTGEAHAVDPGGDLAGPSDSAAVFVLDPAFHAEVRRSLARSGTAASEISVPDALRDPAAPRRRYGEGFRALDAAPLAAPDFAMRLARLLEAAPPGAVAPPAGGEAGTAAGVRSPSLAERIGRIGRAALAFGLPLAALAVLVGVETRWRRAGL